MTYTKTKWASGDIIEATKLNNIESGLGTASDAVTVNDSLIDAIVKLMSGDENAFVIKTHPVSEEVAVGGNKTFSVSVYPDNAPVTYQWQNRSIAATAVNPQWTNSGMSGATTKDFTVPVIAQRYTYEWRCAVTNTVTGEVLYSRSARITEPPAALTSTAPTE